MTIRQKAIRQKGESQKQDNKARQIFKKMNISYPLTGTRTFVYQGVRNVCFSETWRALYSCSTCFEIRPFVLLSTIYRVNLCFQSGCSHKFFTQVKKVIIWH